MHITSLQLKNFRCFQDVEFRFDSQIVVIEGHNGSGKSSIIEALHYACYLRSLRTHTPREMITFDASTLCIKVAGVGTHPWHLTIGLADNKRLIKVDERPVTTYKELVDTYCIISAVDDDMALIKGSPDERRAFMDHGILIEKPTLSLLMRRYRKVVEQRNSWLSQGKQDPVLYDIWTEQLWQLTREIQTERQEWLCKLGQNVRELIQDFFPPELRVNIQLRYRPRKNAITSEFGLFKGELGSLVALEYMQKRSLFGAHLDDLAILWQSTKSKSFASRGQQKLMVILLKIAQFKLLNRPAIIALDDFATDFDAHNLSLLMNILISLDTQLIITCPSAQELMGHFKNHQHLIQRIQIVQLNSLSIMVPDINLTSNQIDK